LLVLVVFAALLRYAWTVPSATLPNLLADAQLGPLLVLLSLSLWTLAWILDHVCGWRGFRRGQVGVYHRQPLALVNFGGATASEIMTLARAIEHDVRGATGIDIEMEVLKVGTFK
jgi:UDP-N-acetylenolpyruvoylglucosamine reductase